MAYNLERLFRQVQDRLDQNAGLRLRVLANDLGVDRHTIEKAVRLAVGTSFRRLQQEKLLHRASELLLSDHSKHIKEIAWLLGYTSKASFTRFVKNATGHTPTSLRRKHGGLRGTPNKNGKYDTNANNLDISDTHSD